MPVSTATTVAEASALLVDAPSPVIVIPVYDAYDDVVQLPRGRRRPHRADDRRPDRRRRWRRPTHRRAARRRGRARATTSSSFGARAQRRLRPLVQRRLRRHAGPRRRLLNSDVIVGPEWLERLTAAALSTDTIATATTPHQPRHDRCRCLTATSGRGAARRDDARTRPLDASRPAAGNSGRRSPPPSATASTSGGRRSTWSAAFDDAVRAPATARRSTSASGPLPTASATSCADDVFTFHRAAAASATRPRSLPARTATKPIVRPALPVVRPWVGRAGRGPASRSPTPSARLGGPWSGSTWASTRCQPRSRTGWAPSRSSSRRSARSPAARRSPGSWSFVPPQLPPYVEELRDELPDVEFIGRQPVPGLPERVVDLMYRPCQVSQLAELDFIARGRRALRRQPARHDRLREPRVLRERRRLGGISQPHPPDLRARRSPRAYWLIFASIPRSR